MIRLIHHVLHVPVKLSSVMQLAGRPLEEWPAFSRIDDQHLLLPLVPAGLTEAAGAQVPVRILPGPIAVSDNQVLHRLAFEVPGATPLVRGDLIIQEATGHGLRVRFRGDFRSTRDADTQLREVDAAESITQPLVGHIASTLLAAAAQGKVAEIR